MKIPQITIYAKNTGLEIGPYEKRSEGKPKEGRICLRFFTMENPPRQVRFIAEPAEGYELFRKIGKVSGDRGKESVTHRFDGNDGETVTKLTVESYERSGKAGYAFSVQRGPESINVPLSGDQFLHAAEFLRHLSLAQAWVELPA
ncbi:MAG TPA: hypothetical protein VIU40_08420 [Geobacteraceae bacterium]